jgi:hypothetical protein
MSSQSPYQHPYRQRHYEMPGGSAATGGIEGYGAQAGIVTALTLFFLLDAGFDALTGLTGMAELMMGQGVQDRIEAGDPAAVFLGLVSLLAALGSAGAYLLTAILYCVWIHGANKNARALGADGMTFTPGWCVGWFFIPIANLFKPYQAVAEIYRTSDPEAGPDTWVEVQAPPLLGLWWGAWIVTNLLAQAGLRISMSSTPSVSALSPWFDIINAPVGVAAALLAMAVVRRIHARQKEKAARLMFGPSGSRGLGAPMQSMGRAL